MKKVNAADHYIATLMSLVTMLTMIWNFFKAIPPNVLHSIFYAVAFLGGIFLCSVALVRWTKPLDEGTKKDEMLAGDPPLPKENKLPLSLEAVASEGDIRKPELTWPLKVRMTLRNSSRESIQVGPTIWVGSDPQTWPAVNPKEGMGWSLRVGEAKEEREQATIAPGKEFEVWWGLQTELPVEFEERQRDKRLGQLIVYGKVDGKPAQAVFQV